MCALGSTRSGGPLCFLSRTPWVSWLLVSPHSVPGPDAECTCRHRDGLPEGLVICSPRGPAVELPQ